MAAQRRHPHDGRAAGVLDQHRRVRAGQALGGQERDELRRQCLASNGGLGALYPVPVRSMANTR
jgi:hypothetical protein